jgi:ABC-2 type transport system permease protein
MSFFRLSAMLHKEFRHIWRDKRTLFLVTLSPAIMLITFSYLFSTQVQSVRLGVWDLDRSSLSRRYISSLTAGGKLVLNASPANYGDIRDALMRGDIHLGLIIPAGFESKLNAGESPSVQAIADGSDAITVSQSIGLLRQRTLEFESHIDGLNTGLPAPITVQAQAWYNRDLDSMFSMVPGLIPIVLILPSLAIALAIAREKELGSFEMLAATPIRGMEYLLGKLIPYIAYGVISAIVAFIIAILWFHVPLRGAALDLLLLTLAYLCASLGESLFISSFMVSQGTAMRVILLLFFIPSFFLAGVILPVDTNSGLGQLASLVLPASYYVEITRGVFLKGLGLSQLLPQAKYLLALGIVPFFLSLLTFRKQVE